LPPIKGGVVSAFVSASPLIRSETTFVQIVEERPFMDSLSRLDVIRLSAFGTLLTLILAATCAAQQLPPIAEQMAKTYGLDSFGQVEGIRYTFNLDLPGLKRSDTWEWDPKTDTVSFEGKDIEGKPVKVTYQRSQLSSQSDLVKNQVDPAFINDQYWLIFPFHVAWDGASVTDDGMHKLPLGKGSAERIVVKYRSDRGYTPGDTWELYVGADKRVEEMVYHRGGPKKPRLVMVTWEGYEKAGPLLFSTEHRGTADGKPLRVHFSKVSVKVTGSENWINAQ
jgi:hypothetical protein